jgi:hypothetical protein
MPSVGIPGEIYVPDPEPDSVFVITAYTLEEKPLTLLPERPTLSRLEAGWRADDVRPRPAGLRAATLVRLGR